MKQEHLRGDGEGFQVLEKRNLLFLLPGTLPYSRNSDSVHLGPEDRTEELTYIMCLELCLAQGECYINVGLSIVVLLL